MSNVSIFLRILIAASVVSTVAVPSFSFAEETAAQPDAVASYDKAYLSPVGTVCQTFKPAKSIIQSADFRYPEIGDSKGDRTLRDMVRSVGGDLTRLEEILGDIPQGDTPMETAVPGLANRAIEAASEAYKERVNGVFACAQIQFKIRIHERIVATVRWEKADAGNLVKSIDEQTKKLRQESEKRKCANASSTTWKDNVYLKKDLLDTAYYQYCDYRHYLQYLKTNVSSRLAEFNEAEKKRMEALGQAAANRDNAFSAFEAPPSVSTEKGLEGIVASMSKVDQEIAHTKEAFPQAILAYQEFERTYGPHVAMLIVTEDYRLLRESLKRTMNPLGQVIYKASNAQSPHANH